MAGCAPKGHRRQNRNWCDDQGNQRQLGIDKEEDDHNNQHLEQLADQVKGQGHDIREILRVRGHAANDFAGRELVVEGHVACQNGIKGIFAQGQHNIAHRARRITLAHKVKAPRQHAGEKDRADQPAAALPNLGGPHLVNAIEPPRDQNRKGGFHQ